MSPPASASVSSPGPAPALPHPGRPPGAWGRLWPAWYRLLRLAGPAMDALARRFGFGNIVVLRVRGRRSGTVREIPLGLLRVAQARYLGHPNGDTAWTRNLEAADAATIEARRLPRTAFHPVRLGRGAERDAVVRATFRQHPFPGNALYRLSGRHVAAHGVFFRLEPLGTDTAADRGTRRAASAAAPATLLVEAARRP